MQLEFGRGFTYNRPLSLNLLDLDYELAEQLVGPCVATAGGTHLVATARVSSGNREARAGKTASWEAARRADGAGSAFPGLSLTKVFPKVAEKAKHGQSMLSGNGVRGAHDEHGDGRGGERFRAEKGFGPSCLVSFGAHEGALWGSPTSRAQPLSAGGVEVGGGVVALKVLWWW